MGGNSKEPQELNVEAEVYNNKICDWGKRKKAQNLN